MKTLVKILLLILFPSYLLSQCTSGDCYNGLGFYTFSTGQTYIGEWKNGKRHGNGFFIGNNTSSMGQYSNGSLNGFGSVVSKESIMFGEYYNNEIIEGIFDIEMGTYVGEYKNQQQNGYGKSILGEDYFEGYYLNGLINKVIIHKKNINSSNKYYCIKGDCEDGLGMYVYNNGEVYRGEWKNGKRHGFGILFQNSQYYVGEFKYDKITGFGMSCRNDSYMRFIGNHLEGEYVDGLFFSDNVNIGTYVGQFKGGNPHGKGKVIFDISKPNYNNNYVEGYFENGIELSTGKYIMKLDK